MGGKKARNNFSRKKKPIVSAKNVGKKIVSKKCENTFLYFDENLDQKMGGKKRAKQFFQEHTNRASKKCWEKNRFKKVRKHVFCIHTNVVTKKGGEKTRETIFPETQIVRAKNVGKKIMSKHCENTFFIFTRIS